MEIAQLRYFVKIAEDMNFGKAAVALGVAQPTLTRSMQSLEGGLGVSLIDRSTRRLKLTPAGVAFLRESREILSRIGLAEAIAKRVSEGEESTLRIGLVPTAHDHGYQRSIRKFRKQWHNVRLVFKYIPSVEQPDALRSGLIDVGFFCPPKENMAELAVHLIDRSGYLAAIPSAWPLARRRRLRLVDLADCPFVFKSREAVPHNHYHEKLVACLGAGFRPNIVQEAASAACVRSLVACEVGVALLPRTETLPVIEGITYVPLVDLPAYLSIDFAMVWSPKGMSHALRALVKTVAGEEKLNAMAA